MATFYVEKIDKLHKNTECTPVPSPLLSWPPTPATFNFVFVTARKIKKVICALKPTEALGVDGIPLSVLKTGVEVLASLIAYLISRSLATSVVPAGLKTGIVHPVHKGSGKKHSEPASYRPVSILTALSKVLETVVKSNMEEHLAKLGIPPNVATWAPTKKVMYDGIGGRTQGVDDGSHGGRCWRPCL
jgi:hypothetical protein